MWSLKHDRYKAHTHARILPILKQGEEDHSNRNKRQSAKPNPPLSINVRMDGHSPSFLSLNHDPSHHTQPLRRHGPPWEQGKLITISTATPVNQKLTPVNESHSMRICNNKNYIRTSYVFGCSLSSLIERGHYPVRVCTGVSRHPQLLGSLAVHVGRSIWQLGIETL